MGGRFSSHLREVVAEELCVEAAAKIGEAKGGTILANLAKWLKVDEATLKSVEAKSYAEKACAITSFKFMKTLDLPDMLAIGEAAGCSAASLREMEEDIKKAGTLVARRVYAAFYSVANRPKWISWLKKTYALTASQAVEILDSMDVLPASKRIPEDTYHALGARNMCHTEFPNHSRAVQIMAEQPGFKLEEFKESILANYDSSVSSRLSQLLNDYNLGYELTPALRKLLGEEVGILEAKAWGTGGIEPEQWAEYGAVQKTLAEFQDAYFNFRSKCIAIAKAVAAR